MDITAIVAGTAALKTGLDTLRTAMGLVKDVQGVLPEGEKKQVVGASLAEVDRQIRIAEAQIAKGLGCKLCECQFPPTPMLTVGYIASGLGERIAVRECPVCKQTDVSPYDGWTRTAGVEKPTKVAPLEPAPRFV